MIKLNAKDMFGMYVLDESNRLRELTCAIKCISENQHNISYGWQQINQILAGSHELTYVSDRIK